MRSLVLRTTYGKAVSYTPEQIWAYVDSVNSRPLPALAPILSCFPILRYWPSWLPGGSFHATAERYFQEDKAMWEVVRDDVKKGMVRRKLLLTICKWLIPICDAQENNTIEPCILSRMYASDAPNRLGFSDLEMAFTASNLFTAGGDVCTTLTLNEDSMTDTKLYSFQK